MNDTTQPLAPESLTAPYRFKKILAPTDFSACADQAFAYALDLARQHGAEVHLLHVIGPLEGDAYSPLRYSPEARAQQETPDKVVYGFLRSTIDKHDTEGVTVAPVKQRGSAVAPSLLRYAKKEAFDLIIMGTHGRHGMQRAFIGSVAERTVRLAPCSVLTVRERPEVPSSEERRPLQIQRILVPIDFSDHSEAVLRAGCALASAYEAQLDVLYVVEPLPFVGVLTGVMTAGDLVPGIEERARRALQDLCEEVSAEGLYAKMHVEEGHAAAHIVDFAARFGTDLIVIGSQGRSAVERFFIGSVAERVVRTAQCPVLTFKALPASASEQDAQEEAQEEETSADAP